MSMTSAIVAGAGRPRCDSFGCAFRRSHDVPPLEGPLLLLPHPRQLAGLRAGRRRRRRRRVGVGVGSVCFFSAAADLRCSGSVRRRGRWLGCGRGTGPRPSHGCGGCARDNWRSRWRGGCSSCCYCCCGGGGGRVCVGVGSVCFFSAAADLRGRGSVRGRVRWLGRGSGAGQGQGLAVAAAASPATTGGGIRGAAAAVVAAAAAATVYA